MTQTHARWVATLAVAALALSAPVQAAETAWRMIGPYGARVSDIVVDPGRPQTVYMAASTGALFKSTDGGSSWTSIPGSTGYGNTLAIDPTDPRVIYAGSLGVHKSTDGGASWTWFTKGFAYLNMTGLAVARSNPKVLYASTLKGVHRSLDGGETWTQLNSLQSSAVTTAMAVDPTNADIAFFAIGLGDKNKGVYRTRDGGATWTRLKLEPAAGAAVERIVYDPTSPLTVYATAWGAGVYRSVDGAATWTAVNAGLTDLQVYAIALDPSDPRTLYAGTSVGGVYRSADGGTTWAALPTGVGTRQGVVALAVDPSRPATIYAGTPDGVFRTLNRGTSWSQVTTGVVGYPVSAMARSAAGSRTLYVGTSGGGLLKTPDGGETWIKIDVDPAQATNPVMALASDLWIPKTLYAGLAYGSGGFKSTDGGVSWARIWSAGGTDPWLSALAVDPIDPNTIYLGTGGFQQPRDERLLKSTDGGRTWNPSARGLAPDRQYVSQILFAPSKPRTVYLVGNRGGTEYLNSYGIRQGVYRSTDGGANWNEVGAGILPDPASWTIAVDPSNDRVVYAGLGPFDGASRLYKSADGGNSWAPSGTGLPGPVRPGQDLFINSLAVDPATPRTIFAATIRGMYRSTDGGASWAPFGILGDISLGKLVIDPESRTVYAAMSEGGVAAVPVPDMAGIPPADFNGDGAVDWEDFFLFAEVFGKPAGDVAGKAGTSGTAGTVSARFDLDGDWTIGLNDFFLFADRFGRRGL